MKHLFTLLWAAALLCGCTSSDDDGGGKTPGGGGDDGDARRVASIETVSYWYDSYNEQLVEDDRFTRRFVYDDQGRVSQMLMTDFSGPDSWDMHDDFTVRFTYDGTRIAYESVGQVAPDIFKSSAELDEKGRIVSGLADSYVKTTDREVMEYTVAYDDAGRMIEVRTDATNYNYDSGSDQTNTYSYADIHEFVWENGNSTKVISRSVGDDSSYSQVGRARYGKVRNKANLDLSWLTLLSAGWTFIDTPLYYCSPGLFTLLGYHGTRSEYLPERVEEDGVPDSVCTFEYEVDKEGYPTKIIGRSNEKMADLSLHLFVVYNITYEE